MLPLECLFWIWQRAGRWRVRPEVTVKAPVHSPPPCGVQNSAGLPLGPHCPPHSRRGPGAWWASPASGASCGCGASGRAHRPRGPSRSDRKSSSWCTPGRRAPLRSRWGWEPIAWRVLLPFSHQQDHLFPYSSPPAARVPQAPAKEGPAQEPEIEKQGPVLKVGGWSGARQALRR